MRSAAVWLPSPVLDMLLQRCPGDAAKLLAVTERDLFIPVLTFVFGQAQLGGRVGGVSFARLQQEFYGLAANREIFLERAYKEACPWTGRYLSGWCTARNAGARCRSPLRSARSI